MIFLILSANSATIITIVLSNQGPLLKPTFIREASPEVTALVDNARDIIRGNGAYNIESNMLYLAENEHDLLDTITAQCAVSEADRYFWAMNLCDPVPPRKTAINQLVTEKVWLQRVYAFTVLLPDARSYLRKHAGNPHYGHKMHMMNAVSICNLSQVEHTPRALKAALFLDIIRGASDIGDDDRDHELLGYMAEHIEKVESQMDSLDEADMNIGALESRFSGATHSTMLHGWL